MTNSYVENAHQTLNKLVSSKIELHKTKNLLEDQLESLKERNAVCDLTIQSLQQQNARLEKFVQERSAVGGPVELNESNLDSMVFPKDPFSLK